MTIPDFQSLMLPLLKLTEDGEERSLSNTIDVLSQQFGLTDEERRELLPSGRQAKFDNRVSWAKTYLVKTMLLESTGRGLFRITERGRQVLSENPERIDLRFLKRFPELAEFREGSKQETVEDLTDVPDEDSNLTPEEILESSYQKMKSDLAQELLQKIRDSSERFFERLVVDLLIAMGYGGSRKDAGQAVGRTGDNGIDGIIKEDKLGLDVVYIQAKHWKNNVGRPELQAFAGSLEGFRARKGVFITTSDFASSAREYVGRIQKTIVLINGKQLADLMIDHNVGVNHVATYSVKGIDNDYFDEN